MESDGQCQVPEEVSEVPPAAQRPQLHHRLHHLPQLSAAGDHPDEPSSRPGFMTSGRIASACLSLVPLAVADADEMVGVLSADALYAFTGGSRLGLDELRVRYARLTVGRSPDGSQEWCNWIVRREVGGQAVGYVQATIMDGGARAGIAWVIGLDWQGHGYAREAARALVAWLDSRGVTLIQAHIHPEHAASAAVARRAGLLPTGHFDDGEQLWQR